LVWVDDDASQFLPLIVFNNRDCCGNQKSILDGGQQILYGERFDHAAICSALKIILLRLLLCEDQNRDANSFFTKTNTGFRTVHRRLQVEDYQRRG
jgi:hypothetical protein